MNKYPDYVNRFRPKGTIIKFVNGTYYVYEATSKRVEGKKYPVQVVKGVVGIIDSSGFHNTEKVKVSSGAIVKECGFTNFILLFKDTLLNELYASYKKKDKVIILYSLICYLSPNSYLSYNNDLVLSYDDLLSKYNLSINKQISSIEKKIEYKLKELENLKYICRVYIDGKEIKSTLNNEQKKLIEKLEVNEDDIR